MATTRTVTLKSSSVILVAWDGPLANSENGDSYEADHLNDVSVHAYGTFDGATLTIVGSNEVSSPANFQTLHKVDLTNATMSANGTMQVLESMQHFRPQVSGGTANTSLTVILKFTSQDRRYRTG